MASLNRSLKDIEIPERIKKLPINEIGFPVPWFVQWFVDGVFSEPGIGTPDFRITDQRKRYRSNLRQCWICGELLDEFKAFVVGSKVTITRVNDEPPNHRECAIFALKACPFIAIPSMRRNRKNMPMIMDVETEVPHSSIYVMWLTKAVSAVPWHGATETLYMLGDPEEVLWFAEGKLASRFKVTQAIDRDLLELRGSVNRNAIPQIERYYKSLESWLPTE